jgi:hypothetical protein
MISERSARRKGAVLLPETATEDLAVIALSDWRSNDRRKRGVTDFQGSCITLFDILAFLALSW